MSEMELILSVRLASLRNMIKNAVLRRSNQDSGPKKDILDEYLLLGLLNSYIVKRQIRTKQFTRDVIDTLGQRLREVTLPLPHSVELRHSISVQIRHIIENRIEARDCVSNLSRQLIEL